MTENKVVALRQKGAIDDPLTEILRTGARRLIARDVDVLARRQIALPPLAIFVQNQLPKVIDGVKFKDGIEAVAEIKSAA